MTAVELARDEASRLRAAIAAHRADACDSGDPLTARDLELWLALKER